MKASLEINPLCLNTELHLFPLLRLDKQLGTIVHSYILDSLAFLLPCVWTMITIAGRL